MVRTKKLTLQVLMLLLIITGQTFFISNAKAEDEVTFAMLPQIANIKAFEKWKLLLDYIEKETGIKITQTYPKDFKTHVELCREGRIDFAYSNPVTYVLMTPKAGVREDGHTALALAKTPKGTNDFYGLFIVRVDNPEIKKLNDIKNKKGWIVGWESAGGYVFQQGYALDNNMDLKRDCTLTVAPANKQEKVIMAVYNRDTDFGCIRNGLLEVVKDQIDITQIKVLVETPKYPAWVFSAYSKVKPEVVEKITRALLKIPKDIVVEVALPGGVTGFEEATDSDLEAVRKVVEKTGTEY